MKSKKKITLDEFLTYCHQYDWKRPKEVLKKQKNLKEKKNC